MSKLTESSYPAYWLKKFETSKFTSQMSEFEKEAWAIRLATFNALSPAGDTAFKKSITPALPNKETK